MNGMDIDWQIVFNTIIGLLTVAGTLYAIRAGQQGKQADLVQASLASSTAAETADRSQRFQEIHTSLKEARIDLEYYKQEAAEARQLADQLDEKFDRVQNEWRIRHRELLERCQEMADVMARILNSSGNNLTREAREQIRAAINHVRVHIAHDHEEIDDTLGGGGGIHGQRK